MASFATSRAYFREKLLFRAKFLVRFLAMNVPESMDRQNVARQVMALFRTAVGFCGDELAEAWKQSMLKDIRQSSGWRQTCDNRVALPRTFPLLCKSCELSEAMHTVKCEDQAIEDERELERIFGPNWREELDDIDAEE